MLLLGIATLVRLAITGVLSLRLPWLLLLGVALDRLAISGLLNLRLSWLLGVTGLNRLAIAGLLELGLVVLLLHLSLALSHSHEFLN